MPIQAGLKLFLLVLEQVFKVFYSSSDSLGRQVAWLNTPEDIDESLFAVGQNVQDLYALKLVDSMVEKPNREVECEHGLYVGLVITAVCTEFDWSPHVSFN